MSTVAHVSGALIVILILAVSSVCEAFVPDAFEDCKLRNAALCSINDLPTMVEGDCPPHATTIRPRGHEDCSKPHQAQTQVAPVVETSRPRPPGLFFGILGLGVIALFALRRQLNAGRSKSSMSLGQRTVVWGLGVTVAVPIALGVGRLTFYEIIASFNNHDTFAPALVAAPVALLATTVIGSVTFSLTASLVDRLFRRT